MIKTKKDLNYYLSEGHKKRFCQGGVIDHVTVGANAVVNKCFGDNVLLVGIPASAREKKDE